MASIKVICGNFFNPEKRKWEFLKIQNEKVDEKKKSIILRTGWSIRKLQKRRPPFHYLAQEKKILVVKKSKTDKTIEKYNTLLKLKTKTDKNFIKIKLNDIHFYTKDYLDIMALEGATILDGILSIPIPSLEQFREILVNANIILDIDEKNNSEEQISEKKAIQNQISELLKLLYSKFLKKESTIEELQIALLTKNIENICDDDVRKSLEFITKPELTHSEKLIYEFLSEKLPIYYNWQLLDDFTVDPTIHGLILTGTSKEYQNKWSTNYFKIILPNFESIVHLQTKLSPTREGIGKVDPLKVRLLKISLKKWRIYPYLGKLKNTGTKSETLFESAEIPFIENSFRTILGIPTIEKILREQCFLDSFNLDLETWRGSYNLSRHFITYVKIIESVTTDGKIPTLLVEDFFGNRFRIAWDFKTYLHFSKEIHDISKNGYISIVIKNVLDNQYNETNELDFETIYGISFRFSTKEEFLIRNILSIIKYVGYADLEILKQFLKEITSNNCDNFIAKLQETNEALIKNGYCYYSYNALNKKQFSFLLDIIEEPDSLITKEIFGERWYVLWSLMRESLPILHPLSYSTNINSDLKTLHNLANLSTILDFVQSTKKLHKDQNIRRAKKRANYLLQINKTNIFQETLVGRKNRRKYIDHGRHMFRDFGQACVRARGRRIIKAHYVARYIARNFSYMEPKITRIDKISFDHNNKKIREVEFYIESYKMESQVVHI